MKKQSNFLALMALVAVGVVFTSCSNDDNPYNVTPPDGKYVLVKDSITSSDGVLQKRVWEYDAEGKMAKETSDIHYSDNTSDHIVSTFTYSENLITRKSVKNDETTYFAYFYLNSKGLIERIKDELWEYDCSYRYDDDDRVMLCIEDEDRDSIVWKNGDVVRYVDDDSAGEIAYFTSSPYEVDFPYMMPFLPYIDNAISPMGFAGKATRHLISNMHSEYETDGMSVYLNNDLSYVVRGGLVVEFTADIDELYTENGETEGNSCIVHHYLTWRKL